MITYGAIGLQCLPQQKLGCCRTWAGEGWTSAGVLIRRSPAGPGAGGAAWGSVALPRPLQELRGRRGSVLPCCGGLDLQHGSVRVPFLAEGARGSRRGLCRLQRVSSHAGTRGAAVRGDGGSWDGACLLQLASLEPIQPVQGLCRRCGRLTRVLLRARLPLPRR